MNRYIDADAAVKRFEEIHGNESELLNCYNADWVVSFIETQPTADVQEVKHAKWEIVGNYKVECTNCHRIRDIKTQCGWNFCPTCGAKTATAYILPT